MSTVIRWLEDPPRSSRELITLWFALATLALFAFVFPPWAFSIEFSWELLRYSPDPLAIVSLLITSSGEECVFRVLPMFALLLVFRGRTAWALLLGVVIAIQFALWHLRPPGMQVCIWIDGVILSILYLKFGGASGKPFNGLLACGGAHSSVNLSLLGIANLVA